jgi:hypothetical protein
MGRDRLEPLVVRVEDTETHTQADHAFRRSRERLGRNPSNDLVAPQPFVSAWHGLIEFDDRGVNYTDLGSTNGSVVDGRALGRGCQRRSARSEVLISSLKVTFMQAEAQSATRTPPRSQAGGRHRRFAEYGRSRSQPMQKLAPRAAHRPGLARALRRCVHQPLHVRDQAGRVRGGLEAGTSGSAGWWPAVVRRDGTRRSGCERTDCRRRPRRGAAAHPNIVAVRIGSCGGG